MDTTLKTLIIDARTSFYRMERFMLGDFWGPVDLGLFLSGKQNSLNIGVGLLAGSLFPGSNRMIFSGFSPCWGGFFISSMGGAGLVFDNLGLNMISIVGKADTPSVLYLNRMHGEEIDLKLIPVDAFRIWRQGRQGVYAVMDYVWNHFAGDFKFEPRILAVGPAASSTDFGAIVSAPVINGKISFADTWAGRGGFGSKLLQEHGIVGIIYGGTYLDEDFRDRKVADDWFVEKYEKKLAAKDIEATTKYRFDPNFQTGGTFGVNYSTLGGSMLSFNYRSIYMDESDRTDIHRRFVIDHYLKQFNEETIVPKLQSHCGEPCVAVCKKMHGQYKKDYEPYQTMGPLSGIFDQRAAEKLNHRADLYGFDAISAGGVLSWLMECLSEKFMSPGECGLRAVPVFDHRDFDVVATSSHNAEIGVELLDGIVERRGILDLSSGARKFARHLSRERGTRITNAFVYNAFARKGWMVPNQYWTPGVLSPMAIMGKYYMDYGKEFIPPRELGRKNSNRFFRELMLDTMGFCRFHRGWAEEMLPEIVGSLYGRKDDFMAHIHRTASRINSRNASVFWESERNIDFIQTFLTRKQTVDGDRTAELQEWVRRFNDNKHEAALSFWYEIHKGIQETLREF